MAFERKGIKVDIKKTKLMVCGLKEAQKCRIDPSGVAVER